MAGTIVIECAYAAPEGWRWAAEINKQFHHPTAWLDGAESALKWDEPTKIGVAGAEGHRLQVFMRIAGLHFCSAEVEVPPLAAGETIPYKYRLESHDRFMNRGHLERIS
jgi:hypothetical protein